ncbi:hypothetical protein DAPPUDRAFT_233947 [Daphnia pulex]|uniref:Uncharacterized protein n=1 Tax=Daphnia pulex TaxID=6669 RepID=E9FW65_DAPPU|nr:hypothetical protein DAPPUDRAFT_233947 [Daphnia pulex]|eukprot:EFX88981.1 hypothetical protein DAPPUDRAFT_233947 [Daphnia pulex]
MTEVDSSEILADSIGLARSYLNLHDVLQRSWTDGNSFTTYHGLHPLLML